MSFFSNNLTAKRRVYGWKQEEAAQKISLALNKRISTGRYQMWERGRTEPKDFKILAIICEVFDIDDLYLFISKDLSSHFYRGINSSLIYKDYYGSK